MQCCKQEILSKRLICEDIPRTICKSVDFAEEVQSVQFGVIVLQIERAETP